MTRVIDLDAEESIVMQSFLDMLMPEVDMVLGHLDDMAAIRVSSNPSDAGYAYGVEVVDMVTLAEIAHVSLAFGSLMYDLLVTRPELAGAMGAFAVGLVSREVTDIGIEHMGALQVVT